MDDGPNCKKYENNFHLIMKVYLSGYGFANNVHHILFAAILISECILAQIKKIFFNLENKKNKI